MRGTTPMRALLLFVGCVVPLLAQDPPPRDLRVRPGAAGTAEIRGRVFAADTGAPVPRAVLTLTRAPVLTQTTQGLSMVSSITAEAGPDGRYVLTNLPAGQYYVSAADAEGRAGYLRAMHGAVGVQQAPGSLLEVAAGQRLEGIDIFLPAAAVIAGQVLDDEGQPLARIHVSALRWTGSRPVRGGPGVLTDDRGRFRLFGLAAGHYLVFAEAPPRTQSPERRVGLLATYSPGTTDPAQARLAQVASGATIEADIRMVRAPLLSLGGLLLDLRGQPVAGGNISLTHTASFDSRPAGVTTDQQGRFSFRNLAPGAYRLVGRSYFNTQPPAGGGREVAVLDLLLDDDLDDLVVMSAPGAAVRLDVEFETSPPDRMRVNLNAVAAERGESLLGGRAPQTLAGAGAVVLTDLFGPVLVRATAMPPNWILKEVRHNGRDITDAPTVFGRTDAVQVILSDRPAVLEGVVRDGRGTPGGPGDSVAVFGDDPSAWIPNSSRVRMAPVFEGGRFSVTGLRPGTYHVAGLRFQEAMNLSEPSVQALEALALRAARVVVGAGETRQIEIEFLEPTPSISSIPVSK